MFVAEETLKEKAGAVSKPTVPIVNRALDFSSAVRFGIVLLVALVILLFLGMIIV